MPAYHNMKPLRLLVLSAIGVVLVFTLKSFFKRWQGTLPGSGKEPAAKVEPLTGEVDQQTRAFSLSKTDGDHTLYTIKAEQVTTLKDTQKNLLHGVEVNIFGKTGTRHDRITTPQCEYDPALQTLWVPGEVEMNFELPSKADAGAGAAGGQRVVIHTSQLHFDQSTGSATTDAPVRFTFPQGEGQSRGARYDPQQQMLHLISAVEFRLRGEVPGSAAMTTIHAGELQYLRGEGRIALGGSVEMDKKSRHLRADSGSIWLNEDNQVQRAELTGDVQATERGSAQPGATLSSARAARALLEFSEVGMIRTVDLLDGVKWSAAGTAAPQAGQPLREGSSQRMLLNFTAAEKDKGAASLDRATASGDVKITLRNASSGARAAASATKTAATSLGQSQVLSGQQAELLFNAAGSTTALRDARLTGQPRIEMYAEPGTPVRTITATSFDFDFNTAGELSQLNAHENVRVVSPVSATATSKPDTRITTSRELVAAINPATGKLNTLRQSGNFTYQDALRKAQAASALYQADAELLTLERALPGPTPAQGQPQPAILQPDGRISANIIKLRTNSGDLEASGAVATTSTPTSPPGSAPSMSREPLHAIADELSYDDARQTAHYTGHTRLWQGTEFLLESESAVVERRKSLLTAAGKVLTIFRPSADGVGRKSSSEPPGTYVIRSEKMSYFQATGRILYEGKVQATQDRGTLTSNMLEITLKASEKNGSTDLHETASRIEKMVARGTVQLTESGRVGNGDTVEYLTENKKVNLYGKPAILTDSARGTTKGVQLSYQIGDNSASVVGDGGEQTETRWIPAK